MSIVSIPILYKVRDQGINMIFLWQEVTTCNIYTLTADNNIITGNILLSQHIFYFLFTWLYTNELVLHIVKFHEKHIINKNKSIAL